MKESRVTIYSPENIDECTVTKYSELRGCHRCVYGKDITYGCEVRKRWEDTEEVRIQMLLHPIQNSEVAQFWR